MGTSLAATVASASGFTPIIWLTSTWSREAPAGGAEHLMNSNLDWGQDLINLREWLEANAPGERVGIAYFGQIPPRDLRRPGRVSGLVPAAHVAGELGWAPSRCRRGS